MTEFLLILCGVLLALVFYFKMKTSPTSNSASEERIQELKASIDNSFFNFSRQIDERIATQLKLNETHENRLYSSLEESRKSYKDVMEKLGHLFETSQKIYDVGKDVASLNSILKSPKLRGGLGEFFLEDLLNQVIPRSNYEIQYKFKSGEVVDAVIKLADEKLVCIDSKFPLENFLKLQAAEVEEAGVIRRAFFRDVKKHVDAIAGKYILPQENTFDFALMYIPAENVYYEIISSGEDVNLVDYCYQKKVIPVSPNNLFVYLQTILVGLKGFEIEQNAKYLYSLLAQVKNEFGVFNDEFQVLGTHLTNARNKYEAVDKALVNLNQSVENITTSGKRGKLE